MLTAKNVTPGMGAHYYRRENYYADDSSLERSRWFGIGAQQLGLRGRVRPEPFEALLHGMLPSGDRFRSPRRPRQSSTLGTKTPQERAGLDLTFSAPKSVSLLALVYGDEQLEKAHRVAVKKTLAIVERRYAQTRIRFGSQSRDRRAVDTGNLVIGQFHHDTSRALDPHLHTHCVLLNMTQVQNGRWYSLRNDRIYRHRKLLGQMYQNELARQVRKLGYRIEPKAHGQFEIAGFTREQLDSVSKRRRQICRQLSEDSTWAEREAAWQTTRATKGDPIPRRELQDVWTHELEALGIRWPQREGRSPSEPDRDEELRKAIADGIEHCSERDVAFPTEDIEQFVLAEVGAFELSDIEWAIAESDELIYLDEQVTTETAVRRELAAIRLMKQGQGKVEAIADETVLAPNGDLTEGQRQAVELAVSTTDRAIAWQGIAGSGKTRALTEVRAIAESQGYVVRGFAPSAEAAKELGDAVGISSATVASLLFSPLPEPPVANQIWAIDEAGLLGAKDALALLQRAEREGAHAIWVGDTRQLSAVGAGNPFRSLQQAGMRTAYLDESRRQKTPELQRAVSLVVRGRIRDGIDQLQQAGCIEIETDEARRQARLVDDYLALTPNERERTLVLAGTNRERLELTQQIRAGLRREGTLGAGIEVIRLKARDLTDVQSRYAHHFAIGDVVMPLYRNRRRGLEKGSLYEVVGKEGDRLLLQSENGTQTSADLHFRKVVFSREQIEIAPGDVLRWTKNDRDLGHRNGQQFWVESIEDDIARVQYANGRFEALDLSQPQHLDYALVSTTYAAQGKTAERVLIAADRTASKESFYVAVSRVKCELQIYAADLDQLVTLAERSRANQNPVELLRQHANREWTAEVGREIAPTTKPMPTDRDRSPTSTDRPTPPRNPSGNSASGVGMKAVVWLTSLLFPPSTRITSRNCIAIARSRLTCSHSISRAFAAKKPTDESATPNSWQELGMEH